MIHILKEMSAASALVLAPKEDDEREVLFKTRNKLNMLIYTVLSFE